MDVLILKKKNLLIVIVKIRLTIPTGIVNVSCNDKLLFDTLMCNKMISEGACECSFGRKQIAGICNVEPLNITCPPELVSKDLAVVEKIKELNENIFKM